MNHEFEIASLIEHVRAVGPINTIAMSEWLINQFSLTQFESGIVIGQAMDAFESYDNTAEFVTR